MYKSINMLSSFITRFIFCLMDVCDLMRLSSNIGVKFLKCLSSKCGKFEASKAQSFQSNIAVAFVKSMDGHKLSSSVSPGIVTGHVIIIVCW